MREAVVSGEETILRDSIKSLNVVLQDVLRLTHQRLTSSGTTGNHSHWNSVGEILPHFDMHNICVALNLRKLHIFS